MHLTLQIKNVKVKPSTTFSFSVRGFCSDTVTELHTLATMHEKVQPSSSTLLHMYRSYKTGNDSRLFLHIQSLVTVVFLKYRLYSTSKK